MHLTLRQRASYLAHLFKAIFRSYHGELKPCLVRLIAHDAIVIDVGAHAGQFVKIFARIAHAGHVYAFEPSSYALSILRTVCKVHRLSNVTVVPSALTAAPGTMSLNLPLKESGSIGFGTSHLRHADTTARSAQSFLVEAVDAQTLDDFVRAHRFPKVSFIKADTEGWELHMLHGAVSVLETHRPVLLLEINENSLQRAGHSKDAIFRFLEARSYAARRVDVSKDGCLRLRDSREDGDYLCIPQEQAAAVLTGWC